MEAGLCVSADKDGRDLCVVVIKGTFEVDEKGEARLAETQTPFVFADAHYGDPGESSIEYGLPTNDQRGPRGGRTDSLNRGSHALGPFRGFGASPEARDSAARALV